MMNEITISTGQFEDLIRDSEKVRILEQLSRESDPWSLSKGIMAAVIGYQQSQPEEKEPVVPEEPEPNIPDEPEPEHKEVSIAPPSPPPLSEILGGRRLTGAR